MQQLHVLASAAFQKSNPCARIGGDRRSAFNSANVRLKRTLPRRRSMRAYVHDAATSWSPARTVRVITGAAGLLRLLKKVLRHLYGDLARYRHETSLISYSRPAFNVLPRLGQIDKVHARSSLSELRPPHFKKPEGEDCGLQVSEEEGEVGSGAWTRTRITSSKGWRATNCTTPERGTKV
jgi:hypothetical protein